MIVTDIPSSCMVLKNDGSGDGEDSRNIRAEACRAEARYVLEFSTSTTKCSKRWAYSHKRPSLLSSRSLRR